MNPLGMVFMLVNIISFGAQSIDARFSYLKYKSVDAQEIYGYQICAVETMPDHVHLLVSIPPTETVANIVSRIKGYT